MKGNLSTKCLVGLAVIVFGVLVLFVLSRLINSAPGTPAYAPHGQVVSGFPPSLIVDSGAQIGKSYSINYSSSTNQYTAQWASSASPQSLAIGYSFYFSDNGWKVLNESTSSPDLQSIYATDAVGDAVNFTAVSQGSGSTVTVTYLQ